MNATSGNGGLTKAALLVGSVPLASADTVSDLRIHAEIASPLT